MRTITTGRSPEGHPQAYTIRTEPIGGAFQTYVTAHCIECGEAYELHWNTGGNHPDYIAKKFRGMGWQFDPYKPRRCICPACRVKPRVPVNPGTIVENVIAGFTTVVNNTNSQEEPMAQTQKPIIPLADPLADPRNPANVRAGNQPRPLTAHEKQKVRLLLDSHFDDDKGRYIDGYDDRRIGEEASVPWALVTEIRELAYGPLKDDPNVVAFKAEATELREEFTKLSSLLDAMDQGLNSVRQRVTSIEGRLINVEARAKKL